MPYEENIFILSTLYDYGSKGCPKLIKLGLINKLNIKAVETKGSKYNRFMQFNIDTSIWNNDNFIRNNILNKHIMY